MSGRVGVPAAQQLRFAKPRTANGPVMRRTAVVNPADRGLLRDHNLRLVLPGWSPSLLVAFRMIILCVQGLWVGDTLRADTGYSPNSVRVFSAMYTALSGPDEVYNQWEPLHYLLYGKGYQTADWSADQARRSYAVLALSAIPSTVGKLFNYTNKRAAFFLLRISLATVSSFVEALFYRSVVDHVSPHVGRYILWGLISSAAFYDAATTLLPGSIAMLLVLVASSFALAAPDFEARRIVGTVVGFSAAIFIGQPLVGLLAVPFILEQLLMQGTEEKIVKGQSAAAMANRASKLAIALIAGLSVLVPIALIDSRAYGRLTFVFLNNLTEQLSKLSSSPNFTFLNEYLSQTWLGFNILFPLALISLPALFITTIADPKRFGDLRDRLPGQTHPAVSLALRLIPMHLWFIVLAFQTERKESLLYPAYPFILLNGTTTVYLIRCWIEQTYLSVTKSPYRSTKTSIFSNITRTIMIVTCLLSFARMRAEFDNRHGPMSLYHHFQNYELPRLALTHFRQLYGPKAPDPTLPRANFSYALDESQTTIELDPLDSLGLKLCLGKESETFASHFLIPDQVEVKFIDGFNNGEVPQPWVPSAGSGLWGRATNVVASQTIKEGFVDASQCHYLINLEYPSRGGSPQRAPSKWDRVFCLPYLDEETSSSLVKNWKLPIPAKWQGRKSWGEYCLLRSTELL